MPGGPAQGRASAIRARAFQLLPYRVELECEDQRLDEAMAYLANTSVQPVEPRSTMRYRIRGYGPYQLFEDGSSLAEVPTIDDALFVVYRRCHARLLDHLALAGWESVHAGLVGFAGRRALVVGAKGSGKTTLLLRLLFDGHAVEGDEMVFVRDGDAVCLPRNFHVKEGTGALVPEFGAVENALPATSTSDGAVIRAFDPGAAGLPWRLERAPIDLIVILNRAGRSAGSRPLGDLELSRALMDHLLPLQGSARSLLGACNRMVRQANGYRFEVGGVRETADELVTLALRTDWGDAWRSA